MVSLASARHAALAGLLTTLGCAGGDPGTTGDTTTSSSTSPSTTLPPPTTSISAGATETPTEDETSGGDTEDTGDASSTTAEALCPDTHACIAAAPGGWDGPGMVLRADAAAKEPPACDELYPDEGAVGFDGLIAPDAECACSCGDAMNSACDNNATLRYWGEADACDEGAATQMTVFTVICNNLPSSFPGDQYWQVDVVEASGGNCDPIPTEVLEEPSWETQVLGCGGATTIEDVCGPTEVCTPRPEAPEAQLCIWRDGEHECPEDYAEATTLFEDVNDVRGCQPCSCSDPVGVCDDAEVTLTQNFNCVPAIANIFDADGSCNEGSGVSVRSAILNTGEPSTFCTASEGMPVGEALGADPITVCCEAS